jgi:hypothetical protein
VVGYFRDEHFVNQNVGGIYGSIEYLMNCRAQGDCDGT